MPARPNWFIAWPFETDLDLGAPPDRVRPFAPQDRHVTLAFLGDRPEDAAREAWARARDLPLPPIEVSLGALTLLGNPRHPTAIAALLGTGRQQVEAMMGAHRARLLAAAGARPDDRPPKAHVTLARIQRKASPGQRSSAQDWLQRQSPEGHTTLGALALYTWSEDRASRLFRVVDRRELASAS